MQKTSADKLFIHVQQRITCCLIRVEDEGGGKKTMNIPKVTLYHNGLLDQKSNRAFFNPIIRQPVANEARLKKTLKEQIRMILSEVHFFKTFSDLLRLMAVSATATISDSCTPKLLDSCCTYSCTTSFPLSASCSCRGHALSQTNAFDNDTKLTPKTQMPPAILRDR